MNCNVKPSIRIHDSSATASMHGTFDIKDLSIIMEELRRLSKLSITRVSGNFNAIAGPGGTATVNVRNKDV